MIAPLQSSSEPLIRWPYITDQWDDIQAALVTHVQLTLTAVAIGLVLSAGLALLMLRFGWTGPPITGFAAFVYTIPSVALFGILVPYTGLSKLPAIIALTGYTLLILVTSIVAGFRSVPRPVLDAADGMGLSRGRRILTRRAAPGAAVHRHRHPGGHGDDGGAGDGRGDHRAGRPRRPDPRRPSAHLLDADDRRGASCRWRSRWRSTWSIYLAGRAATPWARTGPAVTVVAAQAAVPRDIGLWEWFSREETWTGEGGILASLADTLAMCTAVMATSVLIAVPLAAVLSPTTAAASCRPPGC